jgi:outer membrane lipoprotein-sorting protein
MRIRQAVSAGLLAITPVLSGCLRHTHSVIKTRPPDVVQTATLSQLLEQVDQRYNSIQSMSAIVHVAASTGGSLKGEVTEYAARKGYIVIEKPAQIRVIILLPLGAGEVLDTVSDGKTFKMLIPFKNCAITGSDVVTDTAQKGLDALRPPVILDSLLIGGLRPDQVVAMTQDSRPDVRDPKSRKDFIEEPDYDIEFFSQPSGQVARALRVIHIGRTALQPYRQDIYNADGKIETQADYSNYQKFGDVIFPTRIVIRRPLDEYSLVITIDTATFNQKLRDDQFKLPIPAATAHVANMDEPGSATIKDPCAVRAPQSPH